ncbi:glutamate synthase subunit beta [Neolewinella lacunae]|uniref:Glutamate synthase subunit beta n=1 Tax=Neolewinella lacunae TaxID=1517758 RepID=A0A923PIK0_9BACT|nr:glutamate synthase subunit beta [Neolewinella lacunae]MBC6994725.1 glutamate synthase subunit beta [Neolewinella lacunae]MDN3634597.1 glutamate synthase subunit beta [Neolewinella lacunae]
MADPQGFLKHTRELPGKRAVEERLADWQELYVPMAEEKTIQQAARCMDCGVPFCHSGCPLGNIIPEFNDAVYEEDWQLAWQILSETNNFPEFTGRICPAPCETACVLGINQPPVAIEHIEKSIAEEAYRRGYARPNPPSSRTGKKVAVIGSGPAGLAAAAQLNKAGHTVTVYERNTRIGGLLRYGIPDFKLEKNVIDRRLALMEAEGIRFEVNANVGANVDAKQLVRESDAVVLAGGSTVPRDIPSKGRDLAGIHFAMDFLEQNNKRVAGDDQSNVPEIHAKGKNVVVIGGGDTGADCVGTSNRHGAKTVTQIEIMEMPPMERDPFTWPNWPLILRTSTSHEEGCEREFAVLTEEFLGDENGHLRAIRVVNIRWGRDQTGRNTFVKIEGSEREIPCELLLIAAGFMHPQHEGLLTELGVGLDNYRNVAASPEHNYQTSVPKVFAAGDMRRGQSLVVWAIAEGRECARSVDAYLMGGVSSLESRDVGKLALGV